MIDEINPQCYNFDEWKQICAWMRTLPYSKLITGEEQNPEFADQPCLALGA